MEMTDPLSLAVEVLKNGGVIVHATEGVWGLACDPFCDSAVERILALKERPSDKGLILIGADVSTFAAELDALPEHARHSIEDTWPGPETWIVPNIRFSELITGANDGVAIRVPGHEQARQVARRFGGPLVSTSANQSGAPAAVTQDQATRLLDLGADFLLPGKVMTPGIASRISTLDGKTLRAG
jgi:L-threonylcarbamoyladenylate synthase